MTLPDLVEWLSHGITVQRVEKAQREATRSGLAWADVLAALTEDQRKAVADVPN